LIEMLSERECQREMELSEEAYSNLPIASSKDRVVLKAIFLHRGLKKSPVTITTAKGQFRVSARLATVAAKALLAYQERGSADCPMEGKLGDILRQMCGGEGSVYSDDEGPLEQLATKLAREALGKLRELTVTAVETEYRRVRENVMQAALSHLSELD